MQHLFLHIGINKTATTFIQGCCARNRHLLRARGIDYPETGRPMLPNGRSLPGHHRLASALTGNRSPNPLFHSERSIEALRDALLEETAGQPRVLLSSEMLWRLRGDDDRRALSVLLNAFHQVTVIAYVRRQDSFLKSSYNQIVKAGWTSVAANFAAWVETRSDKPGLEYDCRMQDWEEYIGKGRMIVRPFVEAAWAGRNIIEDFFAQIDPEIPAPRFDSVERNPSLPLQAIDLLRHLSPDALPDRKRLVRIIADAARRLPPRTDEGLLTPELQQRVLDRYRASNRRLAERWWTAEEARLFDAQQVRTSPKPYSGLTAEEAAWIIAAVWQARVDDRNQPDQPAEPLADV